MAAPPQELKICTGCGRQISVHVNACPYCGKMQAAPGPSYGAPPPPPAYGAPPPAYGPAPGQEMRVCVGCGRQIPAHYNACPYCGRSATGAPQGESMGALKYVLYILSFLFWPLGIIIGIVFMISNEPEKKQVGKMCIILAILSVVLYVVCYFFIFAAIFGGMMGI